MLFRFTVLTLLLTVLAVQIRSEVRSARNFYQLAEMIGSSRAEHSCPCSTTGRELRFVDIDRAELERMLEPPALLRDARIVPTTTQAGERGAKIYAVRPGGVFETLGIRNGDTVLMVNGQSVLASPPPFDLNRPIADVHYFNLDVDRAGRAVHIVVFIHG